MIAFAAKADRRAHVRSKDVIGPREAANLYLKASSQSLSDGGSVGYLTRDELQSELGDQWERKLGKFMLRTRGDQVLFDMNALQQLAVEVPSPFELAKCIATSFCGARRACEFMQGRARRPELEQAIVISDELLKKQLGALWRERLAAKGIAMGETAGEDNAVTVRLPIAEIKRVTGDALPALVMQEMGFDRRGSVR